MVHYIRILKTPQVSQKAGRSLSINAVVTVSTDLGDTFFPADVALIVFLADANHPHAAFFEQPFYWRGGSRNLNINLDATLPSALHSLRLHVTSKPSISSLSLCTVPKIFDVYSAAFTVDKGTRAPPIEERRLKLLERTYVQIWEETGNSIARHIW